MFQFVKRGAVKLARPSQNLRPPHLQQKIHLQDYLSDTLTISRGTGWKSYSNNQIFDQRIQFIFFIN